MGSSVESESAGWWCHKREGRLEEKAKRGYGEDQGGHWVCGKRLKPQGMEVLGGEPHQAFKQEL